MSGCGSSRPELRREAESEKALLKVWEVDSFKPCLRIVGVLVGAGLHADASARYVGASPFLVYTVYTL